MRAVTFAGHRRVTVESLSDPTIEAPTDAVVRTSLAGVCGSDLHPYNGREAGLDPGTAMGHEFVGEVVAVGADVRSVAVGDTVYSPFSTSCGTCHFCAHGLTSRCTQSQLFGWREQAVGLHGGQAELVRVPLADGTLRVVPDGVSAEEALLLGDIFSTGYFCAELAGVQPGGSYAVVGCGPVGILAIIAARALGAETVIGIDTVPERLRLAQECGALTVDFRAQPADDFVLEATGGLGAEAVMEAVGSAPAERLAIDIVRPGGTIAVVGVHTDATFAFSPAEAYDKNLTYRVGRCPARAYMDKLAPLVRDRDLGITRVISHRVPMADAADAYRMFDERRDGCTKVVLTP